jgi:hypothetical protein
MPSKLSMSRPIRREPVTPFELDFSFSQLGHDETEACYAAYERERQVARAGDRARLAKAREFHFVGGML